jgi:hypothetical protein
VTDNYRAMPEELEDFWQRRPSEPQYSRNGYVFGYPFQLATNDPQLLEAVAYSAPLFSQAPPLQLPPFQLQFISSMERKPAGPPPDSLFDGIWYTGSGDWLMIHLGPWGHAFVNLASRTATAVLAPSLAARPDVVSHSLLNTVLLNFCLFHGYGMLHASCLERDGRTLLLMAPHNAGKSTTALHLALAGYRLLTDSMVHVSPFHGPTGDDDQNGSFSLLCGFPVGKIKLRRDMLTAFPRLQPLLEAEQVRGETKFRLDLRDVDPELVLERARPCAEVNLCLLRRHDAAHTSIIPAAQDEIWHAALHNTLFYDQDAVWQRNLAQITPLIERANMYHLVIGSDPEGIVAAVNEL